MTKMPKIGEAGYHCSQGHENVAYLLLNESGQTLSGSSIDFCDHCDEPTTEWLRARLMVKMLGQALKKGRISAEYHRQRVAGIREDGVPDWAERMDTAIETGRMANAIE